jgi:paraquat-inducible protein B
MSRRANFVKIGLFVLTATTLLIGALILFGLREVFKPGVMMETYFDQTVQGLNVGGDVKFRGVKIGTVQYISLVSAAYPDAPKEYRPWVLVRAKIDSEFFALNNMKDVPEAVKEAVGKGMRAYLSPQGITGLVFLELDYDEAKRDQLEVPADGVELLSPKWDVDKDYIYIPGSRGFIKSFMDSTQSIALSAEKFMSEDFPRISNETILAIKEANTTMASVRKYVEDPKLAAIPARIEELLSNLDSMTNEDEQAAVTNLLRDAQEITSGTLALVRDPQLQQNLRAMRELLAETRAVAVTLRKELPDTTGAVRDTLERIDFLIASQQQGMNDVTSELRQVLRNLEQLTSTLKDNPSLVLFSTDPRPVEPAQ